MFVAGISVEEKPVRLADPCREMDILHEAVAIEIGETFPLEKIAAEENAGRTEPIGFDQALLLIVTRESIDRRTEKAGTVG